MASELEWLPLALAAYRKPPLTSYRVNRTRLLTLLPEPKGDPAMTVKTDGLYSYDLAEVWRAKTGLPFVFAVWTRPWTVQDHGRFAD